MPINTTDKKYIINQLFNKIVVSLLSQKKFLLSLFFSLWNTKKIPKDKKIKINKKIKIFLQVNIGDEDQKSGINKNNLIQLVNYCKEIDLDLIGLMCIPPVNNDPENYFDEMNKLNKTLGFNELSMGMSSDFLTAVKHSSTYVRIGSSIFGKRD